MDYFIDITGEVCPLTFVKAKLRVERMAPGETLEIRLNQGEPLENVPRAMAELGHEILGMAAEDDAAADAPYRLRIRKA